ncbi:hypothetical protein I4I65_00800 [Xanthomonas campestris pv. campestris]|nr:hypothetical protein [Xanthomonas campestris pv. campestris]
MNSSLRTDGSIHAANGPAIGKDTVPGKWLLALPKNQHIAPEPCWLLR